MIACWCHFSELFFENDLLLLCLHSLCSIVFVCLFDWFIAFGCPLVLLCVFFVVFDCRC